MYLLVFSVLLLLMKWQQIGPVAEWPWKWIAAPFILTILWWEWADWSGYTKRKAMQEEDQRAKDRRQKQRDALTNAAQARRR